MIIFESVDQLRTDKDNYGKVAKICGTTVSTAIMIHFTLLICYNGTVCWGNVKCLPAVPGITGRSIWRPKKGSGCRSSTRT